MGWAPPADQMLKTFPRTLPGPENFYLVGQRSIPGGSVPTYIASCRQTVRLIRHRNRNAFRLFIGPFGAAKWARLMEHADRSKTIEYGACAEGIE